jgi:O-antigen/teichoic acid export membrane protein
MLTLRQLVRSRAARIAVLSYAAFAASAICSLISIPLAVDHLEKEQIALWTLVTQFVSYLMWMDLGVGSALGRKIADPISSCDHKEINAWWTLSMAVLGSQSILLLAVAAGSWPLWIAWFEIEAALRADALWLYTSAAVGAAISLPLRAYPGLLLSQQRYAWVPASQCVSPLFQLAAFAFCLKVGWGVKSYFAGMIAGHLSGWMLLILAVHLGPLKLRLTTRSITRARARDLFQYSGSIALIGISQSLTQSLPSLMLGRFAGLATVPVYTFSNRIPELLGNLTQRTTMAFYPAMQAQFVENRKDHFAHHFREVQGLTLALGLLVAGVALMGNRTILSWLAAPDFFAGPAVNFWFAIAALVIPYSRTFTQLLQHSGDMGKSSLVSLLSVACSAILGWIAYLSHSVAGLAAVFAVVPSLIMAVYAASRGARNCALPILSLCGPGAKLLVAYLILLLFAAFWSMQVDVPRAELTIFHRVTLLPNLREWIAGGLLVLFSLTISTLHLQRIRSARS